MNELNHVGRDGSFKLAIDRGGFEFDFCHLSIASF